MFWLIVRKTDLMSVRSCALVVIFVYNLVYAHKF